MLNLSIPLKEMSETLHLRILFLFNFIWIYLGPTPTPEEHQFYLGGHDGWGSNIIYIGIICKHLNGANKDT